MRRTRTVTGASGARYRLTEVRIGTPLPAAPGYYALTRDREWSSRGRPIVHHDVIAAACCDDLGAAIDESRKRTGTTPTHVRYAVETDGTARERMRDDIAAAG